jgi:hypothetical protein
MEDIFIMHYTPQQTKEYHETLERRATVLKTEPLAIVETAPSIKERQNQLIPYRVTVAVRQKNGFIDIAYSACSWSDNFSRKTGRNIAIGRLGSSELEKKSSALYKRIPITSDLTNKEIHTLVNAELPLILKAELITTYQFKVEKLQRHKNTIEKGMIMFDAAFAMIDSQEKALYKDTPEVVVQDLS